MHRRDFLALSAALATGLPASARAAADTIAFGLTPVFLDDQVSLLNAWRDYLEERLGRRVVFVQRGSYREIIDLVLANQVQFAWLCGFPFVRNPRMRLLAVPVYRGQPRYQSYLIVPAADTATRTIADLRGKVFAYSDPDSNSGFLYPQYQLLSKSVRPDAYFRRSFFTYSHRKVIEAVAARVAHGGAVDGYIWDTLSGIHPDLTGGTRVAERSPPFGFPPLVAAPGVSPATFAAMQSAMQEMHALPTGRMLLARMNLDRFEPGSPKYFESIAQMARVLAERG